MMRAMRVEALLLAAVMTAVPLYEAFVEERRTVEDALTRYLAAVFVCMVALSILTSLYYSYAAKIPRRRRGDSLLLEVEEVIAEEGGVDLKDTRGSFGVPLQATDEPQTADEPAPAGQ